MFDNVSLPNIFTYKGFENGFMLINYLVSRFTDNYMILMLIVYAFIYFSFFIYIKKYSKDYLLSMIITLSLFFFASMSMMRQAMAMAIILWGVKYIYNRHFLKYLAVVLIATLIHQASIVLLIPYFLYKRSITPKVIMVYLAVTVGVFLLIDKIIFLFADANIRYGFYIDRLGSYSIGSFLILAMYILLFGILYWIYRHNVKNRLFSKAELMKQSFFAKMALLSVMFSIIAINVNALSRFAVFFVIFIIIAIPNSLSDKKSELRFTNSLKVILGILFFGYCSIILIFKPEWYGIDQYKTVITTQSNQQQIHTKE